MPANIPVKAAQLIASNGSIVELWTASSLFISTAKGLPEGTVLKPDDCNGALLESVCSSSRCQARAMRR